MTSVPKGFDFSPETPPERPTVQARLKRLPNDAQALIFEATCGHPLGCGQHLGWVFESRFDGAWVIENVDHYYGYEDTGYHIMDPVPRGVTISSRRPITTLPPRQQYNYASLTPHSIVGELPVLPAKIFCRCGMPNMVAIPKT
jgi:hypothetical protein